MQMRTSRRPLIKSLLFALISCFGFGFSTLALSFGQANELEPFDQNEESFIETWTGVISAQGWLSHNDFYFTSSRNGRVYHLRVPKHFLSVAKTYRNKLVELTGVAKKTPNEYQIIIYNIRPV